MRHASFVRNNLIVVGGQALVYIQGLVLIPLVIKTSGATVYGAYVMILVALTFAFGVCGMGVGFRRSRYLPSAQEATTRAKLFYPPLYFQAGMLLLLGIVALASGGMFNRAFASQQLQFSSRLVLPFWAAMLVYGHSTDYFRYTHRVAYLNYATIVNAFVFVGLVLTVSAAHRPLTPNSLISMQAVAYGASGLPLVVLIVREIGVAAPRLSATDLRTDLRLGLPLIAAATVDSALAVGDRYLIGAFISVTAVGYYSPAYALASVISFFPRATALALPALLARAADEGDDSSVRLMTSYTLRAFVAIGVPFVVGSFLLAEPLLALLTTADIARRSWMVIPIVAVGAVFYGISVIYSHLLFVGLRTKFLLRATALACVLNLGLNAALLPIFRTLLVPALATLAGYLCLMLLVRRYIPAEFKTAADYRLLTKACFASLAMAAVLWTLRGELGTSTLGLSVEIQLLVAITVYVATMTLLRAVSVEELFYLRRVLWSGASVSARIAPR